MSIAVRLGMPPAGVKRPDEATLTALVTALDLYNLRRTDNVAARWDDEVEQLFQELQSLFAKTYREPVYPR